MLLLGLASKTFTLMPHRGDKALDELAQRVKVTKIFYWRTELFHVWIKVLHFKGCVHVVGLNAQVRCLAGI